MLRILTQAYGADPDQTAYATLDRFFSLRRGRMSLLDFLNEFEYLYTEANQIGGLVLNNVGLSHFLIKNCGLDKDRRDHVLLLVNQDLNRYGDIKTQLERMAKTQEGNAAEAHNYYDESATHYYDDDWWYDSSWYDDGPWDNYDWNSYGWDDNETYATDYQDSAWDDWQYTAYEDYSGQSPPSYEPVGLDASLAELDPNVMYGKGRRMKGKHGKGKGKKGKGKGYKGKSRYKGRPGKGKFSGKRPWSTLYGDDEQYWEELPEQWQEDETLGIFRKRQEGQERQGKFPQYWSRLRKMWQP